MTSGFDAAIAAFRDALGAVHVVTSGPDLDAAQRATFAASTRSRAIVRPGTREEVQACVRIAARHHTPLYPVSTGKNWGFGSRLPATDGAVLVELSRMDRIVDFDEELGYLTAEPGVTFEAAHRFLRERGSRLFLSSTGGSPKASLVGNAVERGDGSGPCGDRFGHVCGLEVVLPTGELIHTGFARYDGSAVAPLHRWGVGPSTDGLFSQSSLGIVTRMTFWLTPLPESLHVVRFEIAAHEKLGPLVDAIRRLRMDGTVRSAVGIWNDCRVVSTTRQYPWDLTGGVTPLSDEHLRTLKEGTSGAVWYGVLASYSASAEQGRANVAHVRAGLGPVVDGLFVEEHSGSEVLDCAATRRLDPASQFVRGVPHEGSLRSVYWRKRGAVPNDLDPDRDGCGVLWVCPVLPLRGRDVLAAVEPAKRILQARGFDPLLALIAQTERTAYLVPLIIYDRDLPGADASASACHDELFARFCELGYHPHRLGIQSMQSMPRPGDDSAAFLERLKRALDPEDILSPGRYDFRGHWPPTGTDRR